MANKSWDKQHYHGRYNKYPFTEVVSFVMRSYGQVSDRSQIRVLDLGCGGAHHLMFLAQEGFDYYGVDGAAESIAIAEKRLSEAGFSVGNLVCSSFEKLPYEGDFFDCIIDRGSLTCNKLEDIPPLTEEVHRILKPRGKLFSMILHEACTVKDTARGLGNNDFTDFSGRLEGADVLHFTNATEAQQLFAQFVVEDIELSLRKSEYAPANNDSVTAWAIITCRK